MGFDPKKLEEAKGKFDPEKLKQAKAVGSEAGAPEAGNFDFAGSAKRTGSYIWDNYLQNQVIPTTMSSLATRLPAMTLPGRIGLLAAPAIEGLYQGAAGYLGEKGNQLLGLTEPSEGDALLQGGLQAAPAAGLKGLGMLMKFKGREGAVLANDLAAKEGRRMIQRYKPTTESSVAFDEAYREGAEIPMNNTIGVMRHVMAPIGGNRTLSYAYGEAAKDIEVIDEAIQRGSLSAQDWQFLHTRLGQTIGSIKGKGKDRAKQLYAAMMDDLEQAAQHEVRPMTGTVTGGTERLRNQGGPDIATSFHEGGPMRLPGDTVAEAHPVNRPRGVYAPGIEGQERRQIGQPTAPESREVGFATPGPNEHVNQVPGQPHRQTRTVGPEQRPETPQETYDIPDYGEMTLPGTGASKLKKALDLYRREKSVSDISGYIEGAMKDLRGQGADQQFNAAEVVRKLKSDRFYQKAFSPDERKDIEKTLHVINTAPSLPKPGSLATGSSRINQRIAGASAGAAAGAYIGGPMGAVTGGLIGFTARDAADLASNLAFAMKTKVGREMVKELAKTKSGFFTPRNAAVLSAYVSALRHETDSEMSQ